MPPRRAWGGLQSADCFTLYLHSTYPTTYTVSRDRHNCLQKARALPEDLLFITDTSLKTRCLKKSRSQMFHCILRAFAPSFIPPKLSRPPARYLHRVTGNLINYNYKGSLVSTEVPIVIGSPGHTFFLVPKYVGRAFTTPSLQRRQALQL